MKYVLIGSDGFVGQNLIERNRLDYVSFDSGFLHKKLLGTTKYLDITKDLTELENWLKKNEDEFLVINLAAVHHIPYCNRNPDEAMLTNVYGNMRLYDMVARYGCAKFVFASSGAVYDPQTTAHMETDLILGSDVYSATKILAENYLSQACKRLQTPVTTLRFFNIAGKFDLTPHLIPDIVDQMLAPDSFDIKLGTLSTVRDYISVDDICYVVEEICAQEAKNRYDVLNVGSGYGVTGEDVFKVIKSLTRSEKNKIMDESRIRISDRPVQIANTEKLLRWLPDLEFMPLKYSLMNYLTWRGFIFNP